MILKVSDNSVMVLDIHGRIIGSVDFTTWGGVESANVSGDNWFARTTNGVTLVFDKDCRLINSFS
jgi:hypothetical protein